MNVADVWSFLQAVGGIVGPLLAVLLAVYLFPGSPLRKIVDAWIGRRVAHHFDAQLEDHRHQLTLVADAVRADHQRRLHNAAIVAEKQHAIFRRFFHLLHGAMGKIVHLYGVTQEPGFDAYSLADLDHYMTELRFPGTIKEAVLAAWDTDRLWAILQLRTLTRQGKIEDAERAFAKAWNYFIGNSLYLSDRVATKAREVFDPLQKILYLAKTPAPGTGQLTAWNQAASDRVEELRLLLRAELRVVDEGGDDPGKKVANPA